MNGCYIFIFLSGRKDDEMDPMDPSAYSDAPRYFLQPDKVNVFEAEIFYISKTPCRFLL